ncbi:membrane protein insertase YidC [Buchnera aphidicola]|uniref:membrane protein insertase YidC n=1 Tax=Buchnera aphidicola TaxID=9 RepID=UPI0034649337
MDLQRNILIFSFLLCSFLLWQTWKIEFNSTLPVTQVKKNKDKLSISIIKDKKNIFIKTDTMFLRINRNGGDIEQASLFAYKDRLHSLQSFRLLDTKPDFFYQAQSGLTGKDGPDNPRYGMRPVYISAKSYFQLYKNQRELRVPMIWIGKNGVFYTKTFLFTSGSYDIKVQYDIKNNTDNILEYSMFGQLKQSINLPKNRDIYSKHFALQSFRGAAYSTEHSKFNKYKFNNIIDNRNLYIKTKNGWIAMLQQYFVSAWIPKSKGINTIYTAHLGHDTAAIGYKSDVIYVMPNKSYKINAKLWIGPEIQEKMMVLSPHLDLTVDYGFLWFLSQPLFKFLKLLYNFVGNWGVAIILITLIMRGILYPLTKVQYTSMAKMRALQPKIDDIKNKFSKDKNILSQEMIKLYKREKVNPFGGCLPLLIQMPIFLALYYMLMGSIELRHAPFCLWIHDLSNQDPYYILPIIMGLTMFYIQKISPNTVSDPVQQKILNFVPILFSIFFLWFPSGLVLYYIVSNVITILQQKIIYYRLEKK